MIRGRQFTLDGVAVQHEDHEGKALEKKVPTSFSKQIVYANLGDGEIIKGKRYKASFSSAPASVVEILNEILKDCPETVKQWIATQKED